MPRKKRETKAYPTSDLNSSADFSPRRGNPFPRSIDLGKPRFLSFIHIMARI